VREPDQTRPVDDSDYRTSHCQTIRGLDELPNCCYGKGQVFNGEIDLTMIGSEPTSLRGMDQIIQREMHSGQSCHHSSACLSFHPRVIGSRAFKIDSLNRSLPLVSIL